MTMTTFACGCREETAGLIGERCPAHGAPAQRRVVIGSMAFLLAFGQRLPALPPGGLFYPNIQGAKP